VTCQKLQIPLEKLPFSVGGSFFFFSLFLCFLKQNSQTGLLQKSAGVCSHSVSRWSFLDEEVKMKTNKKKAGAAKSDSAHEPLSVSTASVP